MGKPKRKSSSGKGSKSLENTNDKGKNVITDKNVKVEALPINHEYENYEEESKQSLSNVTDPLSFKEVENINLETSRTDDCALKKKKKSSSVKGRKDKPKRKRSLEKANKNVESTIDKEEDVIAVEDVKVEVFPINH